MEQLAIESVLKHLFVRIMYELSPINCLTKLTTLVLLGFVPQPNLHTTLLTINCQLSTVNYLTTHPVCIQLTL